MDGTGQHEQLPALATEPVRRGVAVIVTMGGLSSAWGGQIGNGDNSDRTAAADPITSDFLATPNGPTTT
jgi:hypothetical protein